MNAQDFYSNCSNLLISIPNSGVRPDDDNWYRREIYSIGKTAHLHMFNDFLQINFYWGNTKNYSMQILFFSNFTTSLKQYQGQIKVIIFYDKFTVVIPETFYQSERTEEFLSYEKLCEANPDFHFLKTLTEFKESL